MKRTSSFSQRLAELRQSKGWTLDEMGKAMGMNPQTLNRYELNQRIPKITDANAMAESVGINPLWLQGYDVEPLASLKREDINEMLTTTNRDGRYLSRIGASLYFFNRRG